MGTRFRKSKSFGPFRITASKSGLSASVGVKGFRVTKMANGRTRVTASIPGTGLSYVKESSKSTAKKSASSNPQAAAPSFPRVHSNASFYFCVFLAVISAMTGISKLMATNIYEMEGWQTALLTCAVFAALAVILKRRNKREQAAYDAAVSTHIAQQQELALRLEEERLSSEKEAVETERQRKMQEITEEYERKKAERIAEREKYVWSTYPIAGVTFRNDDGSSRQKILREICMGDDFGSTAAWLEQYEYQGEDAIRVITDEGTVGNIQRRHVKDLLPLFDDAPDIMRVDAERFETDEGRLLYRADLTIGILRERL